MPERSFPPPDRSGHPALSGELRCYFARWLAAALLAGAVVAHHAPIRVPTFVRAEAHTGAPPLAGAATAQDDAPIRVPTFARIEGHAGTPPLAGAATAQDHAPIRVPTFVRVEDHTGAPLPRAVVTFLGTYPDVGAELAAVDSWQTETDARGRTQAKLLPGLCYVAYAIGPAQSRGADGAHPAEDPATNSARSPDSPDSANSANAPDPHTLAARAASPVEGWFGAGALLTLRCEAPSAPRRIPVDGVDAWRDHGPLQFVAMTPCPGPEVALQLRDGALLVPVGPFEHIEIRTAANVPLWLGSAHADRLALPPPQPITLRANDTNGAPLADVLIRHRVARIDTWDMDGVRTMPADRWRELGRTGADGRVRAVVPYASDPLRAPQQPELRLFAALSDRPEVCGGIVRGGLFENDSQVRGPLDELRFTLPPPSPLTLDVGLVPRDSPAHLHVVAKLHSGHGNYLHDPRSYRAIVAENGTVRFDTVPVDLHMNRLLLAPVLGGTVATTAFDPQPGRDDRRAPVEALAELRVRIGDAAGGPARGLVAFLTPADRSALLMRDSLLRFPLDARGEAVLRVAPGKWIVAAFADAAWLAQQITVDGGQQTVPLQLRPMPRARLELRDDDGAAVSGARVVVAGTALGPGADPVAVVVCGLRQRWFRGWQRLRTDANGRLELPFVPTSAGAHQIRLEWGDRRTSDVALPNDDTLVSLRPR